MCLLQSANCQFTNCLNLEKGPIRNAFGCPIYSYHVIIAVADPGFPLGGVPTHWGDANLRRVHFSAKTYAKTKEIDPVRGGGGRAPVAPPLDPPMYCGGNRSINTDSDDDDVNLVVMHMRICDNRAYVNRMEKRNKL